MKRRGDKHEVARLIDRFRSGGLSRRDLATGLTAVTAAWATTTDAFANDLSGGWVATSPTPADREFVPSALGGGLDDYPAIQAAIDAAAAAGGGRVLIEGHLEIGLQLRLRSAVQLAGTSPFASSISAHPSFAQSRLITTDPDAHDMSIARLTLDSRGLCNSAVVSLGAGANRVDFDDLRLTGWTPSLPWVIGIRLAEPPSAASSNLPIRNVVINRCHFDSLGNGVSIAQGASHIAILQCRFTGNHRRCIWLAGSADLASSHVRIVGNQIMDIPLDPDLSQPIKIGEDNDLFHEYIHLSQNVVIANGSYNGPGGLGAGDHFSLHCVRHSQVICNASVDSSECGFVLVDSHDVTHMGNTSVASDAGGFALKGKFQISRRNSYIGNYAWNNGQNRQQRTGFHPWVFSGFRVHDGGAAVIDTSYIGNYAWDSQAVKTQPYGLAIAHPTVRITTLTGNTWRANQHLRGALYNNGNRTTEASYQAVPRLDEPEE